MLEFLKSLAVRAGIMALADRQSMTAANIHTKATAVDMVTDTDRKVEKLIVSELRREFPGCSVFGEEGGKDLTGSEYCFIIDPIDGTASFIHDLPNWCVSIGVQRNGVPFAGVIYQPVTGDLYYAESGKGAFMNGRRIHVSERSELHDCIVATGFSCLRAGWKEENNLAAFCAVAQAVSDIRKYGSAALDCCMVARGGTDFFWEYFLQPYDVAAGAAILREAGGVVSDFHGKDDWPGAGFLASNGIMHEQALQFFRGYRGVKR